MAVSVIMSVTYGINPSTDDDPYVEAAENALNGLIAAGTPGTYLGERTCGMVRTYTLICSILQQLIPYQHVGISRSQSPESV